MKKLLMQVMRNLKMEVLIFHHLQSSKLWLKILETTSVLLKTKLDYHCQACQSILKFSVGKSTH